MNITVNVDEVSLSTSVADTLAYDEEGNVVGESHTIGEIVAQKIVERLAKEDRYHELTRQVQEIRKEVIREAVRPQVEEALNKPFRRSNIYGEPAGEPVTLRELIVDEVRRVLKDPADKYNRDRGTVLEAAVHKEVEAAFASEIREAVKQTREQVSDRIGQIVADAVSEGMRKK